MTNVILSYVTCLIHIIHDSFSKFSCMSHVALESVIIYIHIDESCRKIMSRVTYFLSHVAFEWVISYMLWSHVVKSLVVSHINQSRHTWIRHVTRHVWLSDDISEFLHTYESVISHMNQSYHIWISHVTYKWVTFRVNKFDSRGYEWVFSQEWVMPHIYESCHICHVTHERVRFAMLWLSLFTGMSHVSHVWVMSHVNESRYA